MGITSSSSKLLSHPDKLLRNHLLDVGKKSRDRALSLRVDLTKIGLSQEDLADMLWIIGVCHDYGKSTRFFQEYIKGNNQETQAKRTRSDLTNHSHLSSLFTYQQLITRFKGSGSPVAFLIPVIGYEIVKRHHGDLGDLSKELLGKGSVENQIELEVFKKQVEATDLGELLELYRDVFPTQEIVSFIDNYEEIYNKIRKSRRILRKTRHYGVEASVLTLFCFSVLVCTDKEDASGLLITRNPELIEPDLIEKYREMLGYNIPKSGLNRIRNDIYLSAHKKVDELDLDDRVLSLNMPTGSGKTLTALNFALRLRERIKRERNVDARIIYSVSFISIIDQNSRVFEDAYSLVTSKTPDSNVILKHHHLADIIYDSGNDELEYDALDSLFLVEGWNSEVVFTTFVQLFHSLLTNRNRALRKLHRVANSIVLLDEVQSIPYEYWLLFREFLKVFSEFFQTYFVFMTATMPYIFSKEEITEIVDNPEQYLSFFNRVNLISRVKESGFVEYLSEITYMIKSNPDKRYLLIHNTIKSSQQVYGYLRTSFPNKRLFYLSTMVTPKERLRRIQTIRDDVGPIVVVSTQVVEAGVDIDVDVVYRDFAPLDSVIQASGRCNRNFNDKRGSVYLVNLVDERPFYYYIYGRASILITRTFEVLDKHCIPEAGFRELIERFYYRVKKGMSDDKSERILGCLRDMNFEGLRRFRLIENDYPKVDVFIEDDIEAKKVWMKYLDIRSMRDWKKKREEFLILRKEFFEHVITVPESYRNVVGWSEDTEIGYISLGEERYDRGLGFIRDESVSSSYFL